MLVKDLQRSVDEADRIACDLMRHISKEVREFHCDNESAEIIYLVAHVMANLLSRINVFFYGVDETYDIELSNKALKWIFQISEEYIDLNKDD